MAATGTFEQAKKNLNTRELCHKICAFIIIELQKKARDCNLPSLFGGTLGGVLYEPENQASLLTICNTVPCFSVAGLRGT